MPIDIEPATELLQAQWTRLDRWLHLLGSELDRSADEPSVLDAWTIGELVSHLGRAMDALTACATVPAGTVPLTLAEYVGTYPDRAAEIGTVTRDLDADLAPDRLGGIERLADAAFARLRELAGERVVQARRGPISLRDMVVSRILELTVHGDDLARSFPRIVEDPVDPQAMAVVADELLHVVVTRGGWSLEVAEPRLWVRLATGRVTYDVDELARALRPVHMSDAVPDLGRMLPLL